MSATLLTLAAAPQASDASDEIRGGAHERDDRHEQNGVGYLSDDNHTYYAGHPRRQSGRVVRSAVVDGGERKKYSEQCSGPPLPGPPRATGALAACYRVSTAGRSQEPGLLWRPRAA